MKHSVQPIGGFPVEELDRRAWYSMTEEQRGWIMRAQPDTILIWHARLFGKVSRTVRENQMLDGLRCFLRLGASLAEKNIRKDKRHGIHAAK